MTPVLLIFRRCSYQFYLVLFCETSVEALAGMFLDSHHQEKILHPICAIHFWIQAVFIFASFLQSRGAYLCQSGVSKKQKPRNISKETPVRKHRPEILRVYEVKTQVWTWVNEEIKEGKEKEESGELGRREDSSLIQLWLRAASLVTQQWCFRCRAWAAGCCT